MKKVQKTNQPSLLGKHESVVKTENLNDDEFRLVVDLLLDRMGLAIVLGNKDFVKIIKLVETKDIK